jgi:hypothetical protein
MNTINYFESVTKPTISQNIEVEDYLQLIKNSPYSELIEQIRRKELDKKTVKQTLPAVTWNFIFNKYKKDSNIIKSTGYLYYDIDNHDNLFNINLLNKNLVYSYYKSVGGNGYAIIVQVDNINIDNFETIYYEIAKMLNINEFIDKNAAKKSQFNIISYDPDIYINSNSYIFDANDIINIEVNDIEVDNNSSIEYSNNNSSIEYSNNNSSIEYSNNNSSIEYSNNNFIKLKYKVELDNYNNEECIYIAEGKLYYECFIPFDNKKIREIKEGNRELIYSSYINNLILLNPQVERKQLYFVLSNLQNKYSISKLNDKELYNIIDYKLKNKDNLKPINSRMKKYWVNPQSINKYNAYQNKRSDITTKKLYEFFGDIIYNINSKITYKTISEYTGLSEITIKRNITNDMKNDIKQFNNQFDNQLDNKSFILISNFIYNEMNNIDKKITNKYIANYLNLSEKTINRNIDDNMKNIIKQHNNNIKLDKELNNNIFNKYFSNNNNIDNNINNKKKDIFGILTITI